ncbi:hypothetical protein HNR46_001320 [Haloferula luteola]|uniref:Uncharacterized protein n=1 Tax=Haloferula luteola TaxID=595692 RepID=A0A840V210_9BACT|nr:hypothetical protein [Haloferula luteola]MBB5351086.1 hypothetical protein [Haloferula luteola]
MNRKHTPTSREKTFPGGLSKAQKSRLAQEAAKAFEVQDRAGLIDRVPALSESANRDTWRRAQQQESVGKSSLRDCQNRDFRPLMAHWLTLQGRDAEAFRTHMRSGRVKDHGARGDTHEAREDWRALILKELGTHAIRMAAAHRDDLITAAYVESEARRKYPRTPMRDLTHAQLRVLFFHIRNRIAAREGRGRTRNRNKSQRKL